MDNRILLFAVFLIIAYMLFNKRESLAVGGIFRSHRNILRDELLYDKEYRIYNHHHHHHHSPHWWRNYHHRHYHPYHSWYY
jgi:hypothetical protein